MATSTKPTFYTVFSNSMKPDEYLPNLSEEATKISDLLHGLVFSDTIYYMKDEIFTADRLIANFSKYGDKFDIFYFSGHAKDGALKFSDNFISNTDRMADVININLRNLQLGFFNACETFDLAKKIVERRSNSGSNSRLVMITCGCSINAFLAEKFATLFFNHVGRPGTYYDAFKNASTLLSLVNHQLRFREFYDYNELANATADFDYAFIDVPVPAKVVPSAPARVRERTSAPFPAVSSPSPSRRGLSPSPAAAAAPASTERGPDVDLSATGAAWSDDHGAETAAAARVDDGTARARPSATQSIINPDKTTMDILSANFIKECTQTVLDSNALGSKQKALLNEAIRGTRQIAGGTAESGKVKQLWKEAARILPGVDSKNDFRSLIKVSRGTYDKALNHFFGKAGSQPKIENIQAPDTAKK
jgi:hypothetical protein